MRPEEAPRVPTPTNATFDEQGFLESLGLTKYETSAYLALLALGVSDARELSRKSGVPTSKIYETMVRLEALGLIEVQASRPRKFMAREVGEALEDLKGAKRREFDQLLKSLPSLETRLKLRAHTSPRDSTFWSVTTSWNDFASKHLAKAAEAEEEVLVYLDLSGCFGNLFQALKESRETGKPLAPSAFQGDEARILEALRAIREHLREGKVNFRILVGAGPEEREAARQWVLATAVPQHFNRFRLADPGRQQFLVIDRDGVGLLLMNPARVGTPLGSVFAKDPALAREITAAFEEMWDRGQPMLAQPQATRR
ncbi:MAG: TrmB family transcriptional regulator [Thermoplasmatota archaeon]